MLIMGSAASRTKRVAPALERTDLDGSLLFCTTADPKRPQQGCLSLGHGSDGLSTEERLEEAAERVLEPSENTESRLSKRLVQKAFFRSRLCYGRRGQSDTSTNNNITLVHNEGLRRGHHAFEYRDGTCPVSRLTTDGLQNKRISPMCKSVSMNTPQNSTHLFSAFSPFTE